MKSRFFKFLDTTLPLNFRLWLNTFYGLAATIFVVSYSTPIFIAAIIPIMVLYYFFQVFFPISSINDFAIHVFTGVIVFMFSLRRYFM